MPASTRPTPSSRRPSSASSQGGQRLAALLFTLAEVHGLGLQAAQGLALTEGYYWDRDDESREFAQRFFKRTDRMPNMIQAGTYSAVTAVPEGGRQGRHRRDRGGRQATARDAGRRRLRPNGKVQANGRMVHDMYLFQVKKPSESTKDWDYYK